MQGFHPDNKHQGPYPFEILAATSPELASYLTLKADGSGQMLNFADPHAVRALNRAILEHDYGVKNWHLPVGFLCPAVPGRIDYLHHVHDLMKQKNLSKNSSMLDIGTGANGIYAFLAASVFQWQVIATDVSHEALRNVQYILQSNPNLASCISIREQPDPEKILEGVIQTGDQITLTVCNPPFYDSKASAHRAHQKKHVAHNKRCLPTHPDMRSTGGMDNELHYPGGEIGFISKLIAESGRFRHQIRWFTTLVSKTGSMKKLEVELQTAGVSECRVLPMRHGNKSTRILAWCY